MAYIEMGIPTPTLIVRTWKGAHFYWLYKEPLAPTPENLKTWREVQKRLVLLCHADINYLLPDPARILRVPYTLHQKNPSNPVEIKILSYKPEMLHTLNELGSMLPSAAETEISSNGVRVDLDEKTPAKEILFHGVNVGEGKRHYALSQVAGLALKNAKTDTEIELARLAVLAWDEFVNKSPEALNEREAEITNTIKALVAKRATEQKETTTSLGGASIARASVMRFGDVRREEHVIEWAWNNFLAQGYTTLLSAIWKKGKTTLYPPFTLVQYGRSLFGIPGQKNDRTPAHRGG